MKLFKKFKEYFYNRTLASKIRLSYILAFVPLIVFMVILFIYINNSNKQYEEMMRSAVVASDFSLDFKKDFDYETYLLIVGNKSPEESRLDILLGDAQRVIGNLRNLTTSAENAERLQSVTKYLENLKTYKERIEKNLESDNKYEENIEIWENDIQIVTTLIRESVFQYIFYEMKELEQTRLEYQSFYTQMMTTSLVAFVLLAILLILFSVYIPKSITRPITQLSNVMDQVSKGDLSVRSNVNTGGEVGVLSDSMNVMIDKINELLEQVTTEQVRLRTAELELLQSQINPHFLYNTLDTITWLAEGSDRKMVVSMVKSLSDFFRTTLNKGKDIICIEEELHHVKSYLEIQQVRYQDIMEYEIDVPSELNNYMIPKITIQPLVENALYHGIKNKRGKGKITIYGTGYNDYFILTIHDNGIGMTPERLAKVKSKLSNFENKDAEATVMRPGDSDGDVFGLYNVNERIALKFGKEYGISVESVYTESTTVTVKLPCYLG